MKTRIALFGPPGSGKGTQAKYLAECWELRHISTGLILRQAIAAKTSVGRKAEVYMNKGDLVPDHLVHQVVEDSLGQVGYDNFVLDGYPRRLLQAQQLDKILGERGRHLDMVLLLTLPTEIIVKRLTRRRVHKLTGEVFHLDYKPPTGIDPKLLVLRPDDRRDVVWERLRVYRAQTQPVEDWYRKRGLLIEIDADGSIDEVHERVDLALAGGSP